MSIQIYKVIVNTDIIRRQMDKFHKGMTSDQHQLISDKTLSCPNMMKVTELSLMLRVSLSMTVTVRSVCVIASAYCI